MSAWEAVYWRGRDGAEREKWPREKAPICWFTCQMPAMAGGRQEPGMQSRTRMWVAGTHLLEPSLLSPGGCVSRRPESRLGTKPRHSTWAARALTARLTAAEDTDSDLLTEPAGSAGNRSERGESLGWGVEFSLGNTTLGWRTGNERRNWRQKPFRRLWHAPA